MFTTSILLFASLHIVWIFIAVIFEVSANAPISPATTAKPFPASPALAASIEAFRERRFVLLAMLRISVANWLILDNSFKLSIACSTDNLVLSSSCFPFSYACCALLHISSASSFTFLLICNVSVICEVMASTISLICFTSLYTLSTVLLVVSSDADNCCVAAVWSVVLSTISIAESWRLWAFSSKVPQHSFKVCTIPLNDVIKLPIAFEIFPSSSLCISCCLISSLDVKSNCCNFIIPFSIGIIGHIILVIITTDTIPRISNMITHIINNWFLTETTAANNSSSSALIINSHPRSAI